MKIYNLSENCLAYTSNVYLALGTWNSLNDINTLIDTGNDYSILQKLERINTGVGKNKIDQVILTHCHSDHIGLLPLIRELYNPVVYAFSPHIEGVDQLLRDGDPIIIGDRLFEVFHITAHSSDSICLYCEEESLLFAGDTTFPIYFENDALLRENYQTLSRLLTKRIKFTYKGHGFPQEYKEKALSLYGKIEAVY